MARKRKKKDFTVDRFEIRLSGSGGQGLITAGVILAEAISVGDGKNAVNTQSYGPEARGGRTRCDVVFSNGDIYYPEATELDLLLAVTQEAVDAYVPLLKDCGTLIIDTDVVQHKPTHPYVGAAFTNETIENLGSQVATNIVCLGFICQYTKIVTKKSLEKFVLDRFPKKFEDNNMKALKLGYRLAKSATPPDQIACEPDDIKTEIDRI